MPKMVAPFAAFLAHLCVPTCLWAQVEPGGESDRRIMKYLASLSDPDLGRKLGGVQLEDGSVELAGHTLLHRIILPAQLAHVYVLREDSPAMSLPTARVWIEPKGKLLPIPDMPPGEPREAVYSGGEVYTSAEMHPGDGLLELSWPTESWIKSLQTPAEAAKWGFESMATIEDPDGFTNVRDDDGKVIATVKTGERFLAVKPFAASAQWEVHLADGTVGLIHESRVRILPGEPLMKLNFAPCKAAWKQAAAHRDAEAIKANHKPHPDDYYPTLLRASEGDLPSLSRFFARKFEDAPSEYYVRDAWALLHVAGDAPVAQMIEKQPPEFHEVSAILTDEWTTAPISNGKKYLERHFPRSSALLFRK